MVNICKPRFQLSKVYQWKREVMQKGFGHWGQGKKVVVALHLDAHGRRFDGAVLRFQISAATDSHLVLANSIYDRRKLHEPDEMTNVVSR